MDFPHTNLNLYQRLNDIYKSKLNLIYETSQPFYARTTWHGWIDHSLLHIENVLHRLDDLIPLEVMQTIPPEESFVLLASAVLHDIGMCPSSEVEKVKYTDEFFNDIRNNHGEKGERIVETLFGQLLRSKPVLLTLICDIVKNHHGKFEPKNITYENFNYPAQAMLVRLADNLDFGKTRAPFYLFEILANINDQKKYWDAHLKLEEPIIDNKLFRIQINGEITHNDFISQIRENFEKSDHAAYQMNFFQRSGFKYNCKYIIWDNTIKKRLPGEEVKRDPRPIKFNPEGKLIAAQALYNSASYFNAITFFENEVQRETLWYDYPYNQYIYHYLQTKNKIGMYSENIEYTRKLNVHNFSKGIQADIQISNGIAYYNLQNYKGALICFTSASDILKQLPNALISFADTLIWRCIICLSDYQEQNYGTYIESLLSEAIASINTFKRANPNEPESHYMGRFNGFMVYYELFIKNSNEWDTIINYAEKAYGGSKNDNRVDFGIMAGKYTEAIAYIYKYKYQSQVDKKASYETLIKCAGIMIDVLERYKQIYGNYGKNIKTIWDKIYKTGMEIANHTKGKLEEHHEKLIHLLEELKKPNENIDDEINNLTPLN